MLEITFSEIQLNLVCANAFIVKEICVIDNHTGSCAVQRIAVYLAVHLGGNNTRWSVMAKRSKYGACPPSTGACVRCSTEIR